jgi:hypothetical protein
VAVVAQVLEIQEQLQVDLVVQVVQELLSLNIEE